MKRLFDFTAALFGIVVLSPLMLLLALAIRASSAGPVLFRQVRVGRRGVKFEILKFRSMRVVNEGRQITVTGDDRITPIGSVLRKTKLDELPQLFNVLIGEMSIVGPRPEVPRYVDCYPSEMKDVVLSVRPGITDNAAIVFRNESDILVQAADPEATYVNQILPQKLELYRQYVEGRTFLGDLKIIFRTFGAILSR